MFVESLFTRNQGPLNLAQHQLQKGNKGKRETRFQPYKLYFEQCLQFGKSPAVEILLKYYFPNLSDLSSNLSAPSVLTPAVLKKWDTDTA
ncbi:hypothetical protein CEXT_179831 [Caerostris extrusa]|uniref:Uncharacterized protein n=1 Tax=Caerostris extrusa TaxID=172846 RepID=A0AAV4NNJ6_CAEEX|nr:hypothetical protein CEXT_179831 [Caerostris extrusa]